MDTARAVSKRGWFWKRLKSDTMLGENGVFMNMIRVALAGNPNCGKSTLFNALTGAHHKVGNYPGVTVERREGIRERNGTVYQFTDLPGTYSLTAYSVDEVVARDFLLEDRPDVVIDVLDSTNLERNLNLYLQLQELGLPVAGALNMSDEADAKGILIDEKLLSASLGLPFVKITAQRGRGLDALLDAVDGLYRGAKNGGEIAASAPIPAAPPSKMISYGEEVESCVGRIKAAIGTHAENTGIDETGARYLAIKLLEKDRKAEAELAGLAHFAEIKACAAECVAWIERHFGKDSEIVISEQRYGYIHGAVREAVRVVKRPDFSLTHKIDAVVMHEFLALPIFVFVLWGVFQLTFTIGAYPQEWLEVFFGFLSGVCESVLPDGLLKDLLVNGVIAGVGGVFSFVPLVVLLFFFLSILEDLGYMSRAAFATDKLLHSFGLHGQSIFPMMLGFGCSVPAVLASRTLKSRRDRVITVLVTPMMSCGAKLPIHLLFAAVFFPHNAANMVMLIYAAGAALALLSAFILKRTVLKGEPTPFVMELPPYRLPTMRGILWHVWEKVWEYFKRAGTIIMASSVLIWAITAFPVYELSPEEAANLPAANLPAANLPEEELATARAVGQLENSIAGRIGRAIAPVFAPLGFNWRMSAAVIPGFAAKEIVVSTLGILYKSGVEETEESASLQAALANDETLTPLAGFTFMLFMLLIPPCFAALATIRAEIGWKWLAFETVFLLALGYLVSLAVFQIGSLIGA
jgi:ferrous iron transport protein B